MEVEKSASERSSVQGTPKYLFYPRKTCIIAGWLDLVVNGLLPFTAVEYEVYRRAIRYENISRNTLMKYMNRLTSLVDRKVEALLPQRFSLVFDGSTANLCHFGAIYAIFPSTANSCGYGHILLVFSNFESEDSQSTDSHADFIKFLLSVYNRTVSNVSALISDNCHVNKSLANKLSVCFIGYASH